METIIINNHEIKVSKELKNYNDMKQKVFEYNKIFLANIIEVNSSQAKKNIKDFYMYETFKNYSDQSINKCYDVLTNKYKVKISKDEIKEKYFGDSLKLFKDIIKQEANLSKVNEVFVQLFYEIIDCINCETLKNFRTFDAYDYEFIELLSQIENKKSDNIFNDIEKIINIYPYEKRLYDIIEKKYHINCTNLRKYFNV